MDTGILGYGSGSTMTATKEKGSTDTLTVMMTPPNGENNPSSEPLHDRDRLHYHVGKVDFPRLDGSDLSGWIFCCQHYFEVDETPEVLFI